MESRVNYTLVGFFVIIMTTALIVILFWMTAGRHTKEYHNYLVYMNESVAGLSEQAPVKFNGVKVGYVETIHLDTRNPQLVRILLAIEEETPVTTSTRAMLMSQGITGVTYMGLKAESSKAPPLVSTPGEPYPVIPTNPSLLVQLDKAIRDVSENVNDISRRIKVLLSDNNMKSFSDTLAHVDEFSAMLHRNNMTIENSLKGIETVSVNTAKASKTFPDTVRRLQTTLASIREAAKRVSETMQASEHAVDSISDQAVPPAVNLIQRLDRTSQSINDLTQQLKQNPAMLVRGKVPAQPGPGE